MTRARPRPRPDRDSQPWWDALARHELALQRCDACAAWRWPARALCNRCGSFEAQWRAASGSGRVVSWVVTHHAFTPGVAVPFVTALVRLDEQADLLLPGGFDGPREQLCVGLPVRAAFEDLGAGGQGEPPVSLLGWQPAADAGS